MTQQEREAITQQEREAMTDALQAAEGEHAHLVAEVAELKRSNRLLWTSHAVCILLMGAGLGIFAFLFNAASAERTTPVAKAAKANTAAVKAVKARNEKVRDIAVRARVQTIYVTKVLRLRDQAGKTPRVRDGTPGQRGAAGLRGPAPTDGQVGSAVARFCGSNTCGIPPTAAQVLDALRACADQGGCRGRDGERGGDGAPGRDAPPLSDEQAALAVENYCAARNGCAGPQGAPGPGPSDEQVQAAVQVYCDAHNGCAPPVVTP